MVIFSPEVEPRWWCKEDGEFQPKILANFARSKWCNKVPNENSEATKITTTIDLPVVNMCLSFLTCIKMASGNSSRKTGPDFSPSPDAIIGEHQGYIKSHSAMKLAPAKCQGLAGKNRFGSVIFKEERVCQYNFSGHKLRELYRSHFAAILVLQWLKETSCDNRVTT